MYNGLQNETQTNKNVFGTSLCLLTPGLKSLHRKHVLQEVRSDSNYPQAMWKYDRGTVVGSVCHAEADSRNPLTGVVHQHTTVSGLKKGAGSANVCGMSALCLSASSRKEKIRNRIEKNGSSPKENSVVSVLS